MSTVRRDLELFFAGILLSLIPLALTMLMVYGKLFGLSFDIIQSRHEIVYAGVSALILVYLQHHSTVRSPIVTIGVGAVIFAAFIDAGCLMLENNSMSILGDWSIILKQEDFVISNAKLYSLYVAATTLAIAIVFVISGALGATSTVTVEENDRQSPP